MWPLPRANLPDPWVDTADVSLSRLLLKKISNPVPALCPSHLMLAAQVPSEWTRNEGSLRDARLALRKVVWRALIEDELQRLSKSTEPGLEAQGTYEDAQATTARADRPTRKVGRMNDTAYSSWGAFVLAVRSKFGLPLNVDALRADRGLERKIAVFHVLRCLIGPTIESLILLDRLAWIRDELEVS